MTKRVPLAAMFLLLGGMSHPTFISAAPLVLADRSPSKEVARDKAWAAHQTPAPGLYAAVPFSTVVVVPAEIDSRLTVKPPDRPWFSQIIQAPPVTLVPRRR